MNLTDYMRSVAAAKQKPLSHCHWCRGVDTGTRFTCICGDRDCGEGICPASVEAYEPPSVPRFK